MSSAKNILVFPCGSEVALEIYRSLEHSIHFKLVGANSVDDHGKFVYKEYIGGLPFVNDPGFIQAIKEIVRKYNIAAIYPAMDSVIVTLKKNEQTLGCKVISSELQTTEICLSKSKTYSALKDVVPVPVVYNSIDSITQYPVFLKPDIGYGSRGVKKANNEGEVEIHLTKHPELLILEYLPGKEFTVDCFTNFKGELLFVGPRQRKRITNGISVNTSTMPLEKRFEELALKINDALNLNGAWFFQVKERSDGTLVLMEVASRMAGSSAVYRAKGVNFAMLSVFNIFEMPVSVLLDDFEVELDRALTNRYKANLNFNHVYVDFDDTIIVDGIVNTQLIALLYHFINSGKKIYLITRHKFDINESLSKYRLSNLFDEVIHIKKDDCKWKYVLYKDSIFIDDSFAERKEIHDKAGIHVFSTDMIEIFC